MRRSERRRRLCIRARCCAHRTRRSPAPARVNGDATLPATVNASGVSRAPELRAVGAQVARHVRGRRNLRHGAVGASEVWTVPVPIWVLLKNPPSPPHHRPLASDHVTPYRSQKPPLLSLGNDGVTALRRAERQRERERGGPSVGPSKRAGEPVARVYNGTPLCSCHRSRQPRCRRCPA